MDRYVELLIHSEWLHGKVTEISKEQQNVPDSKSTFLKGKYKRLKFATNKWFEETCLNGQCVT